MASDQTFVDHEWISKLISLTTEAPPEPKPKKKKK
jgi:hypothetical protein